MHKENKTPAIRWRIVGINKSGTFIDAEYTCPCCKLHTICSNYVNLSDPISLNNKCEQCHKEIEIICDWSTLENPDEVRTYAISWKRYMHNVSDHNEYEILTCFECPICQTENSFSFTIQNRDFERERNYKVSHKCQCCNNNVNIILEDSDKYREW